MLLSLTQVTLLSLVFVNAPSLVLAHSDSGLGDVHHLDLVEKRAVALSYKPLYANSPKTYPTPDVIATNPRPAWVAAYNKAKSAGKIPNIPKTTLVDWSPQYPSSYKGNPCSFYLTKCSRETDIVTSPPGIVGLNFDDGPFPVSPILLTYLKKQKVKATHFLIGSRIFYNQPILKQMSDAKEHLAAHSWSHNYMTTLTDLELVAEMGWTNQIVYDGTGHIVAFHRCPYGDCDDRVRAIALEVFGMTIVAWTEDPRDWCLSDAAGAGKSACAPGDGPQTPAELDSTLTSYVSKTKKADGLIILEHENGIRPINAFKKLLPKLLKKGWKPKSIPDMFTPPRPYYSS